MNINSICIIKKLDDSQSDLVLKMSEVILNKANELGFLVKTETDDCDSFTLFVAVGGDGTMIYAMKKALNVGAPVVGVNLGKVGFLAEYNDISFLSDIKHGNFKIEDRMVIQANIGQTEILAVNEIVVSYMSFGSVLKYDLKIAESDAGQHRADGVIIATPTGSTGHAMSAGGAILDSTVKVLEIIPISPLTMSSRPIIVSSSKKVYIKPIKKNDFPIVVKADGRTSLVIAEYVFDGVIEISEHIHTVKLLHNSNWNFYNTLTEKLGWNEK